MVTWAAVRRRPRRGRGRRARRSRRAWGCIADCAGPRRRRGAWRRRRSRSPRRRPPRARPPLHLPPPPPPPPPPSGLRRLCRCVVLELVRKNFGKRDAADNTFSVAGLHLGLVVDHLALLDAFVDLLWRSFRHLH